MNVRSTLILGLLVLAVFGFGRAANADEETPKTTPTDSTPSTPTTPSTTTPSTTYITVGNVIGQVMKVDSTSITLRVQKPKAPPPGPQHAAGRKQYQQQQQIQQQLARQQAAAAKNKKNNPNYTDFTMDFAVDAQARILHLQPKLDENGKKVPYTADEYKEMKGNTSIPGWKAEISELKVKDTVEAHLVVLPVKAKDGFKKDDLIVRWALIINEPHDAGATSGTSADPTTKKKNN